MKTATGYSQLIDKTKLSCVLCFISVFGIVSLSFGADTLFLSLDECIRIALEQSPAMINARLDSISAAGDWRQGKGVRFPQLRLSGDLPNKRESTDYGPTYNPGSGRYEYLRSSSGDMWWHTGLSLEQALPWGASFTASSGMTKSSRYSEYDDIPGSREETDEYSLRRRFALTQPLLRGNPVGRDYRIARISWDNSLINYELNLRQIKYRAKQLFFALVSASRALEISHSDLSQGESAVELARRKLQAGLIPEVELLQLQVDLSRREGNYLRAEGSAEAASDRLKKELGIPLNFPVVTEWTPGFLISETGKLDSTGNRLELEMEKNRLQRQELETRRSILTERIQASLQVYYELDNHHEQIDLLDTPVDRNFGIILHFDLPLFGFGTTKGKIENLRSRLAHARMDYTTSKVELVAEVRESARAVNLAAQRIKIADAALELSMKSYEITEERFENGSVDSRQLLDAQLDLTRTQTELLNARIDYELALANLERIAPRE